MTGDVVEFRRADDLLTNDRRLISVDAALALLRTTWWADDLSYDSLARAMEHSLCFGVLRGGALVGLARVVIDRTTFAYLTDVVIAEHVRGEGLGRWLITCITQHPDLRGLRHLSLLTVDATGFYEKLGFTKGAGRQTYMEFHPKVNP